MLIAFRVANYCSIRDEQTVLFTRAGSGMTTRLPFDRPEGRDLTPVAAIYGANASGKTNLLSALYQMRWFVRESASWEPGASIPTSPFLLDAAVADEPVFFEVQFRRGAREYRYGFEASRDRFVSEWLYETPLDQTRRTERRLFARSTDPSGEVDVDTSAYLKGPKAAIARATRANCLFLSRGAQENSRSLAVVYEWFRDHLGRGVALPGNRDERIAQTRAYAAGSDDARAQVEAFLTWADLGIVGIVPDDGDDAAVPDDLVESLASSGDRRAEDETRRFLQRSSKRPRLRHRGARGELVEFRWSQESRGTQELYALAAPIIEALAEGTVLAIDEIEACVHPLMVRAIVTLFQGVDSNPLGAQLVFTTHDSAVLGEYGGLGPVLDRDQVWFVEKERDGASVVTPLTDYRPRGETNLERAYLQGRFGAVPLVPDSLFHDGPTHGS